MARKSLEGARQPATGKNFMEGRLLPQDEMPSPLAIGVSMLILQSERRRIVALVRREALKNQDLFALQNFPAMRRFVDDGR
jgi:hypothetical protein